MELISALLQGRMSHEEAEINAERLSDALREIKEVDNRQCNLRVIYGIAIGSERDSVQEVTELARNRSKGIPIPFSKPSACFFMASFNVRVGRSLFQIIEQVFYSFTGYIIYFKDPFASDIIHPLADHGYICL